LAAQLGGCPVIGFAHRQEHSNENHPVGSRRQLIQHRQDLIGWFQPDIPVVKEDVVACSYVRRLWGIHPVVYQDQWGDGFILFLSMTAKLKYKGHQ